MNDTPTISVTINVGPGTFGDPAEIAAAVRRALGEPVITINCAAPVVTHDPAAAGKRIVAMCRDAALSDSNTSALSERIDKDKTE